MRSVVVLAVIAALAVLASGCGSHDSHDSPYAKSLDSLCKDTRKQIEKVPRPTTPAEIKTLGERVNTIGAGFVRNLKALQPAPGERAKARRLVTLYAAFWNAQPRLLQLLEDEQYNVYSRFEASVSAYSKQAESLAQALGAKECTIEPVRK
jgi:hypothetical protein